ncbi:response regulator [Desulforhopalus singaporensis]|uniref:Response regulator receiver domain-containing protein n=1 Tax=Desulforhopalus singaporensis TaxID=91360 RepID=A0A1H0STC4_9BACT|nr:response regulator [Desulforhopalus singaporensis]SDP44944.1 Response regulator receiver domain-containing protein [Desulforhopalus singaporensis]
MVASILVVDDEECNRTLLTTVLENHDYLVSAVQTGEEAIARLQNERFDVVITDLQMAKTTGMEVAKFARTTCEQTIVFMITGCPKNRVEKLADRIGVDEYLAKPFSAHDLIHRLAVHLRGRPTAAFPADSHSRRFTNVHKRTSL